MFQNIVVTIVRNPNAPTTDAVPERKTIRLPKRLMERPPNLPVLRRIIANQTHLQDCQLRYCHQVLGDGTYDWSIVRELWVVVPETLDSVTSETDNSIALLRHTID